MRFTATTLEALKLELERELDRPRAPRGPTPVFACATAEMPPAADHPNCVLRNSTLNILAVSDGTRWVRQDTGAVI
ncbi:MAG: hypothetical protein ACK4YQ_08275 [Phenylobacterium sp.]|uniref:hypothetical protein n=1 Tax=Phenylobacterium sp. TaxID=1871053 RepID=UPI00391BE22B